MKLEEPDPWLVKIGYPEDPLLYALQSKAGDLAALWRSTKDKKVIEQYQATLKCLIALGWEGHLDVEDELPDEHLPQEYFDYIEERNKKLVPPPTPTSE